MGMGTSIQRGGDWGVEVAFVHRVALIGGDGRHGRFEFDRYHRVGLLADGAVKAGWAEVMDRANRIGDGHWSGLERGAATWAVHLIVLAANSAKDATITAATAVSHLPQAKSQPAVAVNTMAENPIAHRKKMTEAFMVSLGRSL